jgi:hypothetical protein
MSFLSMNGFTALDMFFNVGFALLGGNEISDYIYILQALADIMHAHDIQLKDQLHVCITDDDSSLKPALDKVFPDSQQQICIWHIQKNAMKNVKEKWVPIPGSLDLHMQTNLRSLVDVESNNDADRANPSGAERLSSQTVQVDHTQDGLLKMWTQVIHAPTEQEYEARWAELKAKFHEQEGLFDISLNRFRESLLTNLLVCYRYSYISRRSMACSPHTVCLLLCSQISQLRHTSVFPIRKLPP